MKKYSTKSNSETSTPPWAKAVAAAARDARLSEGHFRTLIAVSSFANWKEEGRGEAWPVLRTITANFGIPLSTLSRCTNDLAAWGYWGIEKRINPRGNGGRPAHRYWLTLDVAVPTEFDNTKFQRLGTANSMELASSDYVELPSSESMERPSSKTRDFKEQTKGTKHPSADKGEQTNSSTDTIAPPANAEGAVVIEEKIRIRRKLGFPKEFAGMANGCGLDKDMRLVEWAAFTEANAGKILSPSEVRRAFKKWAQEARGVGFVTMPQAGATRRPMPPEFIESARHSGLTENSIEAAWLTLCANRAGQTKSAGAWRKDWSVWCARQRTNMQTQYAGTRIKPNMPLSADDRDEAIRIGLNEDWIEQYWYEFRLEMSASTGKKGFSLNWSHTWRQWCLRKFENRVTNDQRFAEIYGV